MIGVPSERERARIDAALSLVVRTYEMAGALGPGWRALEGTAGATWLHRESLAIVEAPCTGDRLDAPPVVITGDDARLYLTDLLRRLATAAEVEGLLTDLQGAPPLCLEAFRGGQRLVLPRLACVIELRGRKGLDAVRIEDERTSLTAIQAALEALPDLGALQALCGDDLRPVTPDPPVRHWLALGGRLGIATRDGGGFRVLPAEETRAILRHHASAAEDTGAVDRLMAAWFNVYDRRETAGSDGRAEVHWRFEPLDLEL